MTQLEGSLRFVQLPAVTQLLAELGSTGRLCVSQADWTGEIFMRVGQIVDARLGAEHGRAALEAIALALPQGEFSFVDEPISDDLGDALVEPDERRDYLDRLGAEHQRIARHIPSLQLVPRLVDGPGGDSPDTQITIGAAALQLIPALVHGHTVAQVAKPRGLARTLRELAVLVEGGLVKVEPSSTPATADPVRVQPFSTRLVAHRPAPRPRADAPPVTPSAYPPRPVRTHPGPISAPSQPVSAPSRPVMPPAVAARLATARQFAPHPAASAASTPPRYVADVPRLRQAIVRFFLHDTEPTAD